jgi:two-component system sensor histidine kinase PilS (NtrC family)
MSGLITLDTAGRITFANPVALELIGGEELVGRAIREVFPLVGRTLADPARPSEVRRAESRVELHGRDGYIGWSISPLRDAQGQLIGHTFTFLDITRIKEMELSMQRSQTLAVVGEMAAAVAHDIRNPLTAISGAVQLLAMGPTLSDEQRRLMAIVERETEQLNKWIGQFLDYTRPLELEPQRLNLTQLVSDSVSVFRQDQVQCGIRVGLDAPEPIQVTGDASRLKQVLWNLLTNAAQAMPDGGAIDISVARSERDADMAELVVADEGMGVDPAHMDKLFRPFFTTKERGTGLGLATVHRIVEQHGGEISVEPRAVRGTMFRVKLPLHDSALEDPRA